MSSVVTAASVTASRIASMAALLAVDRGTAELHATANALEDAIRQGNPEHTKALLRVLIQELRVNSRAEILPTYRIATPTVCATTSSVERTWRRANRLVTSRHLAL